jgi:hypothetical protein
MSEGIGNGDRLALLVAEASGVVAISRKKIGYRKAMELVGFTADEIANSALYKRVTRRAKQLLTPRATVEATVDAAAPVAVVHVRTSASVSTLTSPSVTLAIPIPPVLGPTNVAQTPPAVEGLSKI